MMTSARIVMPGQAMATIPMMRARTPMRIREVEVDLNLGAILSLENVLAGELDQLVAAAGEDRPTGEEADALPLAGRHGRGNREFLAPGEHVDHRGPVVLERRLQRGLEFVGPLHPHAEQAHRAG